MNTRNDGIANEIKGAVKNVAGHVRDAVGGLTGDKSTQFGGKVDEVTGSVQRTAGRAEQGMADGVDDLAGGARRSGGIGSGYRDPSPDSDFGSSDGQASGSGATSGYGAGARNSNTTDLPDNPESVEFDQNRDGVGGRGTFGRSSTAGDGYR